MRHRDAGSWHVRSLTGLKSALLVASCLLFLVGSATLHGGKLKAPDLPSR
jgi:hypothetical protein